MGGPSNFSAQLPMMCAVGRMGGDLVKADG